jgi:site-specific recombinase XerD
VSEVRVVSSGVPVVELNTLMEHYLSDCELRLYSPCTIETRRVFLRNLIWFLQARGHTECGARELRAFFHYLMHGHEEQGGRFGNRQLTRPVRPITVKDYYLCLRSLFTWLVAQGVLQETPFTAIPKPQVQQETKTPLSPAQIESLFYAGQTSSEPKRNVAILSLLLDTGCRASELVSIKCSDIDLTNGCCQVLGKGNKYRTVYFGKRTAEALWEYLQQYRGSTGGGNNFESVAPEDVILSRDNMLENIPLFSSAKTHEPLTLPGLQQLMKRLKKKCGIRASCSPHAFRRSFAVQTLKNGAHIFSVQAMLGHTDLKMTRTYCALAQTDVEAQHRLYSPLDRMPLTTG